MKEIIKQVLEERKVENVFFAACGGSIAAFYPAKYLLEKESKSIKRIGFYTANEFVHSTPESLDETSLVIICSHQGTTQETIEAGKCAKEKGACVIAFSYIKDSEIVKVSDFPIYYSWGNDIKFSKKKECLGLLLIAELLYQLEGWSGYKHIVEGFLLYDDIVYQARDKFLPEAKIAANKFRDAEMIYNLASGSCYGSAYIETVCILLEMQWINSACIHSGEFFHGPLEIVDEHTSLIVFMGEGKVRELDERLQKFLSKYATKLLILDVRNMGISRINDAVTEYFSPLLLTAVIDVFNHELADVRNHPLSTRRYMWKIEY